MLRLFSYICAVYGGMAGFLGLFCFVVRLPDLVQSARFKAFWRRQAARASRWSPRSNA
jgi:hypothetical protein